MVKFADRYTMGVAGVSGYIATSFVTKLGATYCKGALKKTGGVATAKTRAIGAATLAAMGLTVGYYTKRLSTLHEDIKLTKQYDARQAKAKKAKQKAKQKAQTTTKSGLTSKEQARLDTLQKRVNNIKSESEYSHFENTKDGQEYRNLVMKEIKSHK